MTRAREHWSHIWRVRGLGEALKRGLARPFGGQVPAAVVRGLRLPLRGEDPLVTPPSTAGAEALTDPFLRDGLAGKELGVWTLSAFAINLLVEEVGRRRPNLAVEFSSGVSTIALTHSMRATGAPLEAPWVISVEQDGEHAAATRAMLEEAGLGDAAVVLHAPLAQVAYDGATHSAYELDPAELARRIAGRSVGVAVVDGPAAESGARVTTLPALRPHLRGRCWVMLDDALRDGELYAARSWQRGGLIDRPRYMLREGGLMTGTLLPPR